MFVAPEIDPVALEIGPLSIRWYGLMYLIGFLGGGLLGVYRAKLPGSGWKPDEVWDLLFYIAIGVVFGGRLGYALFYNFNWYLENPHEVLYIWSGGMSFHGGAIGIIIAGMLFARKSGRRFLQVSDFTVPLIPLGLFAGRIGNFINHELWGRVTEVPWGVVFPAAGPEPRHPSQLYEAFFEGLVLFVVIWWLAGRSTRTGFLTGFMMVGYALPRFFIEFLREPDQHLGTVAFNWMTMGQLLSVPLFLIGIYLLMRRQN